jgi:predicted AAA+ superfamily ATPase
MIERILQLTDNHSFFLFGARNTGKSTLIEKRFDHQKSLWINLLDLDQEEQFAREPNLLYAMVKQLPPNITHVVIDEIQKNPKLLDVVHRLIEETDKHFVLTGSSARKLKYGGANLLAGRAFLYHLFPFTFIELGDQFDLHSALQWGLLPTVALAESDTIRAQILRAYAQIYLKEEIRGEQLVRNLDPFRKFLEISAQCNAKIINFSNIAKDVGVDDKTIKNYFSILEDTLLGFFLEPYHTSIRKRLSEKPKFYFFDNGVARALAHQINVPLTPKTSVYGDAFEHFIIVQMMALNSYYQKDFRFSYLRTRNDLEIDLIIERPGQPLLCIEIKSSDHIVESDTLRFASLLNDLPDAQAMILSQDKQAKLFGKIQALPWNEGIRKII